MSSGPIELEDESGVVRFKGTSTPAPGGGGGGALEVTDGTTIVSPATELAFTSGAVVTDAGAGVAQVAIAQPLPRQGLYSLGATLIGDGTAGNLPFAHVSGDVLLDLTDPLNPLFVEAGIYAVTVTIRSDSPITPGGFYEGQMTLVDDAGSGPAIRSDCNVVRCLLAATAKAGTTHPLTVNVLNLDGAAAHTFTTVGPLAIVKLA